MATLRQLGAIQVFAEIYQGATASVYKGYQPALDRVVLVKVLRPEFSHDLALSKRFEEEARLIAKIQHPNVVAIFDYGKKDDLCYFAAEFVEGITLDECIKIRALPVALASFILLQATRGLRAAHDKDILHRDIKPSNILIANEGQVKLTDFGMASVQLVSKDEETVAVSGTLSYLAPELVLGNEIQRNSDIFSLGATLYEMLMGAPAFTGEKPGDYLQAILNDDPIVLLNQRTDIPVELIAICEKMLMKDPAVRYRDCDTLIADLEAFHSKPGNTVSSDELAAYLKNPASFTLHRLPAVSETTAVAGKSYFKRSSWIALLAVLVLALAYLQWFRSSDRQSQNAGEALGEPQETVKLPAKDLAVQPTVSKQSEILEPAEVGRTKMESTRIAQTYPKLKETSQRGKIKTMPDAKIIAVPEEVNDSLLAIENTPPAARGFLRITCTPWAFVFVDGDSMGATPLNAALELTVGDHNLVLRNPEFPPYETVVTVQANKESNGEFSLWDQVGRLELSVSPWAVVYVDGDSLDTTPQRHPFILAPGKHRLSLRHPVLGQWSTEIEIAAGETSKLKFNLINLLSK